MNDVETMICRSDASLADVLKCIDNNAKKTAFLVDDENKMIGLITDGDVRRLLLQGYGLKDKVIDHVRKDFTYADESMSQEDIKELFGEQITIVPILNENKQVVDYSEYYENLHISVAQPLLSGNEYKYLMDAFFSTWISSTGKYISQFEEHFSKYCGVNYGVATSNGTTAIHLALTALGIGSGDEVIVPDLTFAATINAVLYTGATPVIVDIEEDSWCIAPDKIEEAITDKTKAIIPVHIYGQPCDMERIGAIAEKYGLFIVEDCAEAHGAEWDGKKVGSFGQIGCFSFFGNKVITTGEGGMCVTNDPELNNKMRILRDHGMSKERRYYHEVIGFNYRMTNMQAAIGCAQLERIDSILENRRKLEQMYRIMLKDTKLSFQKCDLPHRKKITWLVSALITADQRDAFFDKMKENGIDSRSFFVPLSEMDIYKNYATKCVVSKTVAIQGINMPTTYDVNENVISIIRNCMKELDNKN